MRGASAGRALELSKIVLVPEAEKLQQRADRRRSVETYQQAAVR